MSKALRPTSMGYLIAVMHKSTWNLDVNQKFKYKNLTPKHAQPLIKSRITYTLYALYHQ